MPDKSICPPWERSVRKLLLHLTHSWGEFSKLVFVQCQTLSLSSVCPLLFDFWINTGARWKVCAKSPLNKVYPGQSFHCTSTAERPLPVFCGDLKTHRIKRRFMSLSLSPVVNHILSTFLHHLSSKHHMAQSCNITFTVFYLDKPHEYLKLVFYGPIQVI